MKNIILLLMVAFPLLGQDFQLQIPGISHVYNIPVDTCFRPVYIDVFALPSIFPFELETLEFEFPDSFSFPVEYQFIAFTKGQYFFENAPDTLDVQVTNHSTQDNLWLEEVEYNGDVWMSVRYLVMPGDSLAGFSLGMSGDSSGVMNEYLSFRVSADSVSNWLDFQPMAMGNIWKYSGPAPIFTGHRHEVIDTLRSGDRMYYTVARQRQYYVEYGDDLVEDTVVVYTQAGNRHVIYDVAGGFASPSSNFLPPEEHYAYEYEGLLPQEDGSLDYGYWHMGASSFWTHGIGYTSNWGDGFGLITRLTGYRVNGVSSGNIALIVGINDEPDIQPSQLQLKAFPNPFNGTISLNYSHPSASQINLQVYDIRGALVWELPLGFQTAGEHKLQWVTPDNLAAGLYFIHLNGDGFRLTEKVLLLK